MRSDLRRRTLALLRRAGVPYDLRRDDIWYDGKRIAAAAAGMAPDDILHEAAHWLCASRARRRVVNYGLGHPAGIEVPESPDVLSFKAANHEETWASGGGILMLAMVGGDYEKGLSEHQWGEQSGYDEHARLRAARRKLGVKIPDAVFRKVSDRLAWIIATRKRT